MARKSRKHLEVIRSSNNASDVVTYRTGIYARLSVETEEKLERGTIKNQVEFLNNFVQLQEELTHVDTYIDDDISGTKFDRPAFNRLIEDIKKGKINCIVVKDLSRFGRNYIEAGEYIEKIFPFLKVRFIAINDHYDSNKNNGDIVTPFKNMVNEIYAKDISKKICTSVVTRQKKGEYIGGMSAYGYLKDPKDKHKLIIDQETAPIVKRIFEWKVDGLSYLAIARKLNDKGVLSPTQYKYRLGILKNDKNKNHKWNFLNVKRILLNPIYMGNMVQGKYRQSLHTNKSRETIQEEDWIVVENTHEAIIDKVTFSEVKIQLAKKRANKKKSRKSEAKDPKNNIFKSIIYCGQCGRKMVLHSTTDTLANGEIKVRGRYICPNYRQHLEAACSDKKIQYDALKDTVKGLVVEYSKVLISKNSMIQKDLALNNMPEYQEKVDGKKRIKKLENMDVNLYSDYVEGLLTKDEYIAIKQNYKTEIEFLEKTVKVLDKQINLRKKEVLKFRKAIQEVSCFIDSKELTAELLLGLIERVIICGEGRAEVKFKFDDFISNNSEALESYSIGGDCNG